MIRDVLASVAELAPGEVEFVMTIALEASRSEDRPEMGATLQKMAPVDKERLIRALHAVAEADGEFTESERIEIDRIVNELGS